VFVANVLLLLTMDKSFTFTTTPTTINSNNFVDDCQQTTASTIQLTLLSLAGIGPLVASTTTPNTIIINQLTTANNPIYPILQELLQFGQTFVHLEQFVQTLHLRSTPYVDSIHQALNELLDSYLHTICEAEQRILIVLEDTKSQDNNEDNILSHLVTVRKIVSSHGSSLMYVLKWISTSCSSLNEFVTTNSGDVQTNLIDQLDEAQHLVSSLDPARQFFQNAYELCIHHLARMISDFTNPTHNKLLHRFKTPFTNDEFFIHDSGPRRRIRHSTSSSSFLGMKSHEIEGSYNETPITNEFYPDRFQIIMNRIPHTLISYRDVEKLIVIGTTVHYLGSLISPQATTNKQELTSSSTITISETEFLNCIHNTSNTNNNNHISNSLSISNLFNEKYNQAQELLMVHIRATSSTLLNPILNYAFVRGRNNVEDIIPSSFLSLNQDQNNNNNKKSTTGKSFDLSHHAIVWGNSISERFRFSSSTKWYTGSSTGKVSFPKKVMVGLANVVRITIPCIVFENNNEGYLNIGFNDGGGQLLHNTGALRIELNMKKHHLLVTENGEERGTILLQEENNNNIIHQYTLIVHIDYDLKTGQRRGCVHYISNDHDGTQMEEELYFVILSEFTWCDPFGYSFVALQGNGCEITSSNSNTSCCKIESVLNNPPFSLIMMTSKNSQFMLPVLGQNTGGGLMYCGLSIDEYHNLQGVYERLFSLHTIRNTLKECWITILDQPNHVLHRTLSIAKVFCDGIYDYFQTDIIEYEWTRFNTNTNNTTVSTFHQYQILVREFLQHVMQKIAFEFVRSMASISYEGIMNHCKLICGNTTTTSSTNNNSKMDWLHECQILIQRIEEFLCQIKILKETIDVRYDGLLIRINLSGYFQI
jgi:hypothetical protein